MRGVRVVRRGEFEETRSSTVQHSSQTALHTRTILILLKKDDIMGAASMLTLLLTHPLEFRILLQYKIWHEPKRDITNPTEHATSGWDRATMRRCWEFLDLTSRSFSGVIKELEGDLARVVSTEPLSVVTWRVNSTEAQCPYSSWNAQYSCSTRLGVKDTACLRHLFCVLTRRSV